MLKARIVNENIDLHLPNRVLNSQKSAKKITPQKIATALDTLHLHHKVLNEIEIYNLIEYILQQK